MKAFNINTENLIHIANIENVIDIAITQTFSKSLLISENGSKLLQCDLRHLQTRANASVCLNTGLDYIELDLPFTHEARDLWRFINIFNNTDRAQENPEPIAIAATHTKIIIFRYDIEDKHFKAIRSMDTANPIHSVYFTPFTAIVSADKFFEIDLSTLISEEFLDLSEESLLPTTVSKPMNMFQISAHEYLMCFGEFGIFVNEFGCRTRSAELKWLTDLPIAFAYTAPILYIFTQNGIQVIRINKLDEDYIEDGTLQTFMSIEDGRFGAYFGNVGIYVLSSRKSHSNSNSIVSSQVIRIDSTKVLNSPEN